MKILTSVIVSCLLAFSLIIFSTQITSCSKTEIQHDTTNKIVNDTTILRDTVFDLGTGLIAYYNFRNGNINDSSGFGNHIAFNNCLATTDRFGNANSAYLFSGGSYMRVNNSTSLNPSQITIMAVVKFNGFNTTGLYANEILMKGPSDPSQGIYGIRIHPKNYGSYVPSDTLVEYASGFYGDGGNASVIDSSTVLHSGIWYTMVYTYDGYSARMYINGNLESTRAQPFASYATSYDLYIGKTENPTFPYNFAGVLDELRIYNKALTPELIQGFNLLKQ